MALQLLSADYPSEVSVSANDAILHTAEYYIHFLARHNDITAAAAADDDDDGDDDDNDDDVIDNKDNDDDCRQFISLRKLLSFSRLQKSCEGDVNTLR